MAENNAVVGIYNSHTEAEASIKELQRSGFDMKKLSIVGKDYHTEEHVVGYYNAGDRMKVWGKLGAFWGGFWGFLFGSAFFFIPGIGPLIVFGPLVGWIVGALEGAVVVGGLSALGAGLAFPKTASCSTRRRSSLTSSSSSLTAQRTRWPRPRASSRQLAQHKSPPIKGYRQLKLP